MSAHVAVPVADGQRALAQHAPEVRLRLPSSRCCCLARAVSSRQAHRRAGQSDKLIAVLASSAASKRRRARHAPLRMTHPAGIRG